jgi:hypothetical protein
MVLNLLGWRWKIVAWPPSWIWWVGGWEWRPDLRICLAHLKKKKMYRASIVDSINSFFLFYITKFSVLHTRKFQKFLSKLQVSFVNKSPAL